MTFSRDPATCAFPPHPDLPDPGGNGDQAPLVSDSAARRFAGWLRHARAARARRDAAARDAAEWAARRAWWHRLAPRLGLHGSHLLALDATLLGDTMLIDTRGTGKLASQLAGRDLGERIGEIEMIPVGRIDVTADRIPGRLRISIRRTDPWAAPVPHPATVAGSPHARYVPYPATIREPLV